MATQRIDSRLRQEQIAQAALDLIAHKGLAQVSLTAVARRVGVVPSAIYRHFASKDEVLDAVARLILDRLMQNVDAACDQDGDPLIILENLLNRHTQMVRENKGIPIILLSPDFYFERPDRRKLVYEGIGHYLKRVEELIKQASEDGLADADVDPHAASLLFLGLIQPAAILWHMSDGDFDVTRQTRQAWPMFLRAIQT